MYVLFDERGNYCCDMGKRVILLVRRPPTNRSRLAIPLRLKMRVKRLARRKISLLDRTYNVNRTGQGYDVLQYTVRVLYDCQDWNWILWCRRWASDDRILQAMDVASSLKNEHTRTLTHAATYILCNRYLSGQHSGITSGRTLWGLKSRNICWGWLWERLIVF